MNPNKWGKPQWKSAFCVCSGYPSSPTELHKIAYKQYFTSLGNVLPCVFCRQSYEIFLRLLPIDPYLKSRYLLTYWLYLIKDRVNKKLNYQHAGSRGYKPKKSPKFEVIFKRLESLRGHSYPHSHSDSKKKDKVGKIHGGKKTKTRYSKKNKKRSKSK